MGMKSVFKYKAIIVIVLVLFCSLTYAFSATTKEATKFRLKYLINTTDECWAEFWQIGTTSTFPSDTAAIDSSISYRFASLGIHCTGGSYKITVGFSPLYKFNEDEQNSTGTYDTSTSYPYLMEILEPESNSLKESITVSQSIDAESISGYDGFVFIKSVIAEKYLNSGTYSLADFRITISGIESMPAGTFKGFLVCEVKSI